MFSLKDKTAVITGASGGIGLSTTKRFIEAGAKVFIGDIKDSTELANNLGCTWVKTDVSNEESVKNLMEKASEDHGKIDILVNNAGIVLPNKNIANADVNEYKRALDINLMGVVYGMKYGQRHMNTGGAIVNNSSLAGVIGFAGYGAYCTSKAAVVEITRVAAIELADQNIRVNCICPATVNTSMAYAKGNELELKLAEATLPQRRLCEPEEIAALIHFLASDDCKFLSGQAINVDGGYTAGIAMPIIENMLGDAE